METTPALLRHIPVEVSPESLLDSFFAYAEEKGLSLYSAQEDAILEVMSGNNVILNTPTGSGKSFVALAAHFAALVKGERSFYTAPIKALVSEKFFSLCRELGAENVGMMTGDAAVNSDAPVICCTAEILANLALRDGNDADVDSVVMDEFHYYADRERGVAWQIPLIELSHPSFLLMSATLGNTKRFEEELTLRTGRETALVKTTERPVPLDFVYRETPVHESIADLLEQEKAPVYIVHFTQRAAAEQAQNLMSMPLLTKEEKDKVKQAIGGFRCDSLYGKDLRRHLCHGVGVHHAGLLPKYRLLVEKLAQEGLLKVICGTDTLGVGVNVPIRTVLFTQLCKYDGEKTRVLSVRDFHQIAGRAGRKGFDDEGSVWVQAPAHAVENKRLVEKAGDDAKKRRKLVRKKPPERGYAPWGKETMERLVKGEPEPLVSSFTVSHGMLLNLLDRPGDGCAAVKYVLRENHDTVSQKRGHIRQAIAMYRSLLAAEVVERLDQPDEDGRVVRVKLDLQADFSLNQPLSPFVLEAVELLDETSPAHAFDVLTVVESVLENPQVVLAKQLDRVKSEVVAELKAEGVAYEERMEILDQLEYPKPLRDFLYDNFNAFAVENPWAKDHTIRPKAVARDMCERGMTFREYVQDYGLKRSEGVLLRYLSDAYKGLVQTVPETAKTEEVYDLTEWLGVEIRAVDASLIEEWERLTDPDQQDAATEHIAEEIVDITRNKRAFRVMVRNELFRWVQWLARREYQTLAEAAVFPATETWSSERIAAEMSPYWEEYASLSVGAEARGPEFFQVEEGPDTWSVRQVLLDPGEHYEWAITGRVDLVCSREEQRPVVILDAICPPL